MSNILKKIKIVLLLLLSTSLFFSCHKNQIIKAFVYKKDSNFKEFTGFFYSTKYGGLNYYISNEDDRNDLLKMESIDSIVFVINKKKYISKPLIDDEFSRERNNSDFSFFISQKEHKIISDTIGSNLITFLLFSEKTNMEKLKDDAVIKYIFIDEDIKK